MVTIITKKVCRTSPPATGKIVAKSLHFVRAILLLLALACSASVAAAAQVEALLDRDSVPVGQGARLNIEISGGAASEPVIPDVENLIVNSNGQSSHFEIGSGRPKITLTYSYTVGSNTPGDYQIPAIEIEVGGEKLKTKPLNLKVLASNAVPPPAAQGGAAPGAVEAESDEKKFGFLTVELANPERKHAYVGEIAPVRIRAWLPTGAQVQLRSGIQPEAQGFTLHNVSERGQQSQEELDGKLYTVVTWFGGITATKAGKLQASLSMDAKVAVIDTSAPRPQRRRTGSPFDDLFFNHANAPMIEKDVTLKSEDQEIEVRPLPTEGRPEGFTGAVGEFEFEKARVPEKWKTGEPQQISATLKGTGNFALMKAPLITPPDGWKTYEGKDQFSPDDVASFAGHKIFQFSAVARKAGERDAALAFSYFDPAAGSYKTITSPVTKVEVTGKDIVDDVAAAAPEVKEPVKKAPELVGQHLKMEPATSLVPLVSRPLFTQLLILNNVLVTVGAVLSCLRRRRENPQRRAQAAMEKATREALAVANSAQDAADFFTAARSAIQQRLGLLWNQPPQAITTAEILARIPDDSPVVRFFHEADRSEYNRQNAGEIQPQWRTLLTEALVSLTPTAR